MKKIAIILHCVSCRIKNFFRNSKKNDIYQDCGEAMSLLENQQVNPGENEVEEYLSNYTSTTRWQTV